MLSCQSGKFSLPKNITYLNGAYMSPMLKTVEKAGLRGVRRKRNPADITPGEFFTECESLRQEFATLVNAPSNRIAIISSVSYGTATVARNVQVKKGDNIIVVKEEFPSNYYCWERLCQENGAVLNVIGPDINSKQRGKTWNERILDAIDKSTRVVAISNVHWADGTRFDLVAIRKRSAEVNALLIVDGTQSVGAMPFDVQLIKPDALICAGYKWLLGPYSTGIAYFSDYFKDGIPLEESWINRKESEDFNALVNYTPDYQPGSLRYEVGEHSNFILVPMFIRALIQLNRWKPAQVQEYCKSITRSSIEKLREYGYQIEDEQWRSSHLFGIRLSDQAKLPGIKEALLKKKIYVSYRGEAMRISPNVYNNKQDIERLIKVLVSHAR